MLLLKDGCVHDGLGNVLPSHDVLLGDGKIKAVGQNLSADGAVVRELSGAHVLPGLVSAVSSWGVTGPGWRDDDSAEKSDPVTPQLSVIYAFDHDSMNFQGVYRYGVTTAGITPKPCRYILLVYLNYKKG